MPTFEITAPDGKKYDVTGDNAEGAYNALIIMLGDNQAEQVISQSHLLGKRLIIVITGKGKHKGFDEFQRPINGVLRKSMPDWVNNSAISQKVLQVTPAQPKHGGDGAFYVYLRRQR